MSSTATICSFVVGARATTSLPCLIPSANAPRKFSMKNTGRRITCDGKPQLADGVLDAPLVLEVGDPGLAVGRAHRGVDVVLDALRLATSARRLPCTSSFSTPASQVFCTANTPQAPSSARSSEAASSRSALTTSAPSAASARAAGESGLRVTARTRVPAREQLPGHGAALLAGGARDDDQIALEVHERSNLGRHRGMSSKRRRRSRGKNGQSRSQGSELQKGAKSPSG